MKLKVERAEILPALNHVGNVVEKRQTLPILSNLFFQVDGGKLNLIGTDMETEMCETIADIEGEDCAFTASARRMSDICRMLEEGSVISVTLDGERVKLTAGRSRYTLNGLLPDDFPRLETEASGEQKNWEERLKINGLELKTLFERVSSAMAVQDVRYYLNGVLLEFDNKVLKAVATDGHRLASSEIATKLSLKEPRQHIVPRKAVLEIARLLSEEDESEITMEMNQNHLRLSWGRKVLTTKLIEGKFPDFKGVLETELNVVTKVTRADFLEALDRAAIVISDDSVRGVKINLERGAMRISAKNAEQEEAESDINAEYDGDAIDTGYNVTYLLDAARAAGSEKIELKFQGDDGICVIRDPSDEQTFWLTMPMRI